LGFVFFIFIFEQLDSCGHMREGQIVTAVECLENSSLQIRTVLQFCQLKILPLSEKKKPQRNIWGASK